MPTGAYGLTRNGWFDERFDPEKSSRAYARYMKSLYDQFGDWYLAMAAYDWGPGNVQRAVMRTGYADFWELYRRGVLPGETKNYVPGIIAAIIMAKNPTQYGLDKMVPESAVVSDTVTVDYPIDLRLVADLTERLTAGDRRAESQSASPDHAARHVLRSASSGRHVRCLQRSASRTSPRRNAPAGASTSRALARRSTDCNGAACSSERDRRDQRHRGWRDCRRRRRAGYPCRYASANGAIRSTTPCVMAIRSSRSPIASACRSSSCERWNHLSSNAVKPGRVLTVAEPVKLAPGTRVRGKSAHSRVNRILHQCVARDNDTRAIDACACKDHFFDKKIYPSREEHLSQIEVESCTISYLPQKSACHVLAHGCILLLESRAEMHS